MKFSCSFSSGGLVVPIVVLAVSSLVAVSEANLFEYSSTDTECIIAGRTYLRDERIDNLPDANQMRCGDYDEFPCYCDPSLDPPISCPYCTFPLSEGDLLCLHEGEDQDFVDIDGLQQTCYCKLDDNDTPAPECYSIGTNNGLVFSGPADGTNNNSNNNINNMNMNGDERCTIDLPNGETRDFVRGESLADFLPNNRCGNDDFPCFCNPDAPGGIDCPYCRFPAQGGQLVCAQDGQQVSFVDLNGIDQQCSCQIPSIGEPITSCNLNTGGEDNINVIDSSNNDVCSVQLESGQVITFAYGESYGDYIQNNRCGSSLEFPCFCNPSLPNQMECPYCRFVQADGELVCAKHNQVVSFNDGDTDQTCSCTVPTDPFQDPIPNCDGQQQQPSTPIIEDDDNDGTCTVADDTGNLVTVSNGESFGDLVEGVCGDPLVWPAFCNTQLDATVTTRQQSQDFDTIEYPYCVYTDTLSGQPECARNNEQITYVNDAGDQVVCSCLYLRPGLGGAQSTCRLVDGGTSNSTTPITPTSPPTLSTPPPVPSPTFAPVSSATTIPMASMITVVASTAVACWVATVGLW
mmetsp:Transcript_27120/g.47916  ORF Transcript_27120/g.47916 Transcript_27120/m.47916 type:complete len:575 (-) Transcript_27120:336-2060(-)